MNSDKNDEIEICQNFDLYFHVREKHNVCVHSTVQWMGEISFCTYLHRDSTFSIVRYDDFTHDTTYLSSSTKSNDSGGGFFGAFPGGAPRLKVTFKASDGANEQKLLKIIIGYV